MRKGILLHFAFLFSHMLLLLLVVVGMKYELGFKKFFAKRNWVLENPSGKLVEIRKYV